MANNKMISTEPLADFFERLSYLYKSGKLNEIHSSQDSETFVTEENDVFKTQFLPVDFTHIDRFYIKSIQPGFKGDEHSHHSPTFRLVLSGSIIINGVRYGQHDWVAVPRDVPYSFETDEFTVFAYACNHS